VRFLSTLTMLALTLALVAGTGGPAAAAGSPPVTTPDHVKVVAGDVAEVVPTANDTDPDGDALTTCRFGAVPEGVWAELMGDVVLLGAETPGVYTIDYYACDFESLTKGTITLEVLTRSVPDVRVRKLRRPGRLAVVNRSTYGVLFQWGSLTAKRPDGSRWLRPGRRVEISVRRTSIIWVAYNERRQAFDFGAVRRIRLPRGVDPLPPGIPKGADVDDLLRTQAARPWTL
jgi:hypothetical protein